MVRLICAILDIWQLDSSSFHGWLPAPVTSLFGPNSRSYLFKELQDDEQFLSEAGQQDLTDMDLRSISKYCI